MNLCINADFRLDTPFEQRIKQIKQAGFKSVMMFWRGSDRFEEELLCIIENGLRIENVHGPFHMMNALWTDENAVESLIKLHGAIDCCHNYAIKTLVIHPTDTKTPPPVSESGINYFKGLIRYAKSMNVDLAFENIERPEYLHTIFSECDDENVKLCYDIGHENCFDYDYDILEKYGKRLKALHLHDNDGVYDLHKIPFEGNVDYDRFIKKLVELDYYGTITLEIMKPRWEGYADVSDEEYLSRAFNAAKKLFEMRQQ